MPIVFSQPIRFAEAAQARAVRSILPTTLSSAELESISADILERGLFSARTTYAAYLDEVDHVLDDYLSGKIDLATGRLTLQDKLDSLGYKPAAGEEGSLTDLSSDKRVNLVIEMNSGSAQGYGAWKQGQDPAILDQWPAQELYRAAPATQPRDWADRWEAAGGELYRGRMIALKNAPIWSDISRFGTPYPPFDYGSHMDVRDVDRDTAIELGLIDRDTQIAPETRDFNLDLQYSGEIRSAALRQALVDVGYGFDAKGNLVPGGGN